MFPLSYRDVLLVSLLLDVFVGSLDVLNVHRTEFAQILVVWIFR